MVASHQPILSQLSTYLSNNFKFLIILLTSGVAFAVVVCLQVNFISVLSVFSQLGTDKQG